ncbi:MAG: TlpA family protein disulfide reductase [Synergistaceae bacterium]|jgi:thiol-disulfide isomerase/thioredoxin|nr:TlpA family protein disulfide reductase [Synergistaceae bacterium]
MKKKLLAAVLLITAAAWLLPLAAGADLPKVFPEFSTRGLTGEKVSNALFAEKKVTMLNIWATWCPPCIGEMPELASLARSMPEGSRMAGLILDVTNRETADRAKSILRQSQADFLQILPVEALQPLLLEISAIPTTIFVDSTGKIVGRVLVGARSEKAYRVELEQLLASM